MVDLSVNLCGLPLKSPLVLASGIWGSAAATLVRAGHAGAGAVTAKSCSLEPRAGHENPTVLRWEAGLINAVGLSNPGAAEERAMLRAARAGLAPLGVPLIASVFGCDPAGYAEAARLVVEAEPDLIELNISCPNVEDEFGLPFALDPLAAARVTEVVRRVYAGRLLVKLSPNAVDIVQVGRAVVSAGADGLTAVNTLGPGMLIDVRARRPILTNRVGGVSGAALRPIALRCVYALREALDVPIIGTGGVSTGEHALQMIMAGATAVGLGSALLGEGEAVFGRILAEMESLMREEGIASLDEIRGRLMAEGAIYTVMRVAEARPEGDAGVTLVFDGALRPEPAEPTVPGQFAMLWLPGLAERPYTIMESDPFSVTVARVGRFSEALCALKPGQRLWVRGPYGCGFALQGHRHLLVGGGSGTASLTLLARLALARGNEVTAVVAARSATRLMLAWRFAELGCRVIVATDDGSAGQRGYALDAARPLLDAGWPDALYACGPEVMLRALALDAQTRGLPCWISLERVMKCAMGVCGNCTCGDRLVCRDGPVFSGAAMLEATRQ